jgi:hypothetical protein
VSSAPARTAFSLNVTHGSPGPAILGLPGRIDKVELVELASNETVLFWEGKPIEAARLAKALKRDMRNMTAEDFREAWLSEDS